MTPFEVCQIKDIFVSIISFSWGPEQLSIVASTSQDFIYIIFPQFLERGSNFDLSFYFIISLHFCLLLQLLLASTYQTGFCATVQTDTQCTRVLPDITRFHDFIKWHNPSSILKRGSNYDPSLFLYFHYLLWWICYGERVYWSNEGLGATNFLSGCSFYIP